MIQILIQHPANPTEVKIYEGQLLALNTFIKDESLKKTIEEMKIHEKEHCDFFENEIKRRKILKKAVLYSKSNPDKKKKPRIAFPIKEDDQ